VILGVAVFVYIKCRKGSKQHDAAKKIISEFNSMSDASKWELAHGLDSRINDGGRYRGDTAQKPDRNAT
ncbi:hypothetical protein NO1_2090, partial [Candidatus Termititenax aidoneus]